MCGQSVSREQEIIYHANRGERNSAIGVIVPRDRIARVWEARRRDVTDVSGERAIRRIRARRLPSMVAGLAGWEQRENEG